MSKYIFHMEGNFERSLNTSFIALVSKTTGVSIIKEICPSSLVANRLRSVVGKLEFDTQNAFVGGQQILESVVCSDSE